MRNRRTYTTLRSPIRGCIITRSSLHNNIDSMRNKLLTAAGSIAIVGSLLIAGTAFAQTPPTAQGGGWGARGSHVGGTHMMPGVFGTVSAISGTTLTLTSKGFGGGPQAANASASAKTYTVDASNATILKDGATSTLSSVAVGDMVMAAGTVSGTSVTATTIRDGVVPGTGGKPGMRGNGANASSTPPIQGNGQPVIGGTVSAVGGNTLTVTTAQGGVTYSVDVTNATIKQGNTTGSVSSIAVGDKVVVQGTVNGTSVTASSVIDNNNTGAAPSTSGTSITAHMNDGIGKVFNSIGGFFHNLFGFF